MRCRLARLGCPMNARPLVRPALLLVALFLVPHAAASTASATDSDGDTATGHVGLEGITLSSDGTDVSFTLEVDAFSNTQPATLYPFYFENADYEGIYFDCTVAGTGTAVDADCTLRAFDDLPEPLVTAYDFYYGGQPPSGLAISRLVYVPTSHDVPFTLDLDAAAGEIGFTASYADLDAASGEWFLANIGWVEDPTTSASRDDTMMPGLALTLD